MQFSLTSFKSLSLQLALRRHNLWSLQIEVDTTCPLFKGLATRQKVLLTHGDSVTDKTVANDFKVVGRSGNFVAGWFRFLPIFQTL